MAGFLSSTWLVSTVAKTLGQVHLSMHLRPDSRKYKAMLHIHYPNGNMYQLFLEPEVAADIVKMASPQPAPETPQPKPTDDDYLPYCLNELHKAQATLSWKFLPPYDARANAVQVVLDRLVDVVDALAAGR